MLIAPNLWTGFIFLVGCLGVAILIYALGGVLWAWMTGNEFRLRVGMKSKNFDDE